MRRFRKMRISVKLPLVLMSLCALTLGMMAFLAYSSARTILTDQGQSRLQNVLNARRDALFSLLDAKRISVISQSISPVARTAVTQFTGAWEALPGDKVTDLQTRYIANNPHPQGRKQDFEFDESRDGYNRAHRKYHPFYRAVAKSNRFADLYITDAEGKVMYSVMKNADLGTDLAAPGGPPSGFAAIFKRAVAAETEEFLFQDFTPYEPAGGARSAFMAAPIRASNGALLGFIAVRITQSAFAEIERSQAGLGSSGAVYSVGADRMLRSASETMHEEGQTSVPMSSEPVSAALEGRVGVMPAVGQDGTEILTAFGPLGFYGANWAVVAQQNSAEVYSDALALKRTMLFQGSALMAVVALIGLMVARNVSGPLMAVGSAMQRVASGDFKSAIPATGRGDEIGDIADVLEQFRGSLSSAEALTVDAMFKGAAFEGSSAALMIIDRDSRVAYANQAVHDLLSSHQTEFRKFQAEFDAQQLVGKGLDHLTRDPDKLQALLEDHDAGHQTLDMTLGGARMKLDIKTVTNAKNELIGAVVEWKDVTAEFMNDAILTTIDRQQTVVEFGIDGIATTANSNFADAIGKPASEISGLRAEQLFVFDPAKVEGDGTLWANVLSGESVHGRFLVRGDGLGDSWVEGGFSAVFDSSGTALKVVMIGNDVSVSQRRLRAAAIKRAEMETAQNQVVEALRSALQQLSEGNMTTSIDTRFAPEYEQLRTDFNASIRKLLEAMQSVVQTSGEIRCESEGISASSDDLSKRAENQARTLQQAATSLDALTTNIRSTAKGASQASTVVSNAKEDAEKSGAVVAEAVEAMSLIAQSSAQISSIVSLIENIAFQTNLLALNAGVEAARAGEAGRGFAVVATEVRALAQRSSEAAREINDLISSSGEHVSRGVDLVGEAGTALDKILASISEITKHATEIAAASHEQSVNLDDINLSVADLDRVTRQNAEKFEATNRASHSLRVKAEALTSVVGKYQIAKDETSAVERTRPRNKGADAA